MDSLNTRDELVHAEAESLSSLHEGISSLLSRWSALQMAVQNEWGGRDSFQKYQQLVSDTVSWFSQPKASLYVEDLENFLYETLLLSFNTDIEDGSIEEVAEQLIIMHEESLSGIFFSNEPNQLPKYPADTCSKRTDYKALEKAD